MREKPRDKQRLEHIVEAIDNIFEFLDGKTFGDYKNDKMLRFAIIKNLEIVGEAAYLITEAFKNSNPQIEWRDIVSMRHILVHGYYQIRDEIVWTTIETELQPLKEKIISLSII